MVRLVDRRKLEASLLRDSLRDFVIRFWPVVEQEEYRHNWHVDEVCAELQQVAKRLFAGHDRERDVLLNQPPGSTKSLTASVMFPVWAWTNMPSCRSICSSYADNLALDLSRKARTIVRSEKWRDLSRYWSGTGQPIELSDDQDAKGYFVNTFGGYRYSTSTNGTVTGFHGHFIIVDDPLNPTQAVSEKELKTANDHVSQTLPSRKVSKTKAVTVLIMQRLHQNDPSAVMLARATKGGVPVRHVCLPAEFEGDGLDVVRPRRLAAQYLPDPNKPGAFLLDPVRIPRKALVDAMASLGQYGYSGQFGQRPVPLEGGMFKVERIRVDEPPVDGWLRVVRFWDKAGTKGGGAYTAGVKIGLHRTKRFWLLHCVRGQWDSGQREDVIKQYAKLDGRSVEIGVEQEPGSGGKESAENTVRNLAGYRARVVRPTGDKVMRADPFSVQVNAGNVSMAPGDWNATYVGEVQHFPNSTFKDQVDASSGGFTVLTRVVRVGGMQAVGQQ